MIVNSYLKTEPVDIGYPQSKTYLKTNTDNEIKLDYSILPEEYNVFLGVDEPDMNSANPEQIELYQTIKAEIMSAMRDVFVSIGVVRVLPKVAVSIDTENAIIINWPYSLYRVYFDIEQNVKLSFYGLVIREGENSVQTKTAPLNKDNCSEVVRQIIQYIFNHT